MLKPQLFVGSEPRQEHFRPPANSAQMPIKPWGGLWTSTYDPEYGSGWVQWCLGENFHVPGGGWQSWLLEPEPDVRVLTIDSLADLRQALTTYLRQMPPDWPPMDMLRYALDYERVARDYAAIHLTEDGQWRTRLTAPSLYGWDCETVLWLRWAFTTVTDLGRQKFFEQRSA